MGFVSRVADTSRMAPSVSRTRMLTRPSEWRRAKSLAASASASAASRLAALISGNSAPSWSMAVPPSSFEIEIEPRHDIESRKLGNRFLIVRGRLDRF